MYLGSHKYRQRTKKPLASLKSVLGMGKYHDASWSDLTHDVLLLIMMQVGVIDFLAFSRVCKSWRSLALSNKNKFLESRPPMSIWIRPRTFMQDCCYLEDSLVSRKTKITLPHSSGRTLLGSTCGYLILFGEKKRDFWLVNPITKHGLHFPGFPFSLNNTPETFRGILVFSRSMFAWVFVMVRRDNNQIWFSTIARGKAVWSHLTTYYSIFDLHAFKGKIYVITRDNGVCVLRLNPIPKVTLLNTKNKPDVNNICWEIVSLGENFYVVCWTITTPHRITLLELDTGKMNWVQPKNTIGHAFLVSVLKHGAYFESANNRWPQSPPQYALYAYFHDESNKFSFFKMWYYTHDCMSVDIIHE